MTNIDDKNTIIKLEKEIDRLKKSIKKQRYGLVWMDIPEAFEDDVENKIPILKEIPDLAIKNDDGKPTHILIEGDNYHALTCLNYTHKGKIDFIYIDPPYNTGSDGFRYKDKRIIDKFPDGTEVPKDHPFRHSYWLSFMRKRLEMARDLLKESGVIFINIDDNEQAQLKLLCNYVFQEKNFVANYIWESRSGKGATAKNVVNLHEYVLCYSKDINKVNFRKDTRVKTGGTYEDERGLYNLEQLRQWGQEDKREDRPTMFYPVIAPDGTEVFPIKEDGSEGRWRVGPKKMKELLKNGDIEFIQEEGRYSLFKKIREGKTTKTAIGSYIFGVGTASTGTLELKNFFKDKVFDTTKPVGLIKYLINLVELNDNAIILDFFAGSGTTGHSIMESNEQNNKFCRFILCTNNEENICSEVCYPRLEKVIKGYTNQRTFEDVKGLGNSLKYYKTSFIGKNNILNANDEDKVELAHNAGELLAIAENTLELINQNEYYQLFSDANNTTFTAVYFREELDEFDKFVDMIEKLNKKTNVYVFSWSNDQFIEEFEHIENVQVKTIPQPIVDIYKTIYNLVY